MVGCTQWEKYAFIVMHIMRSFDGIEKQDIKFAHINDTVLHPFSPQGLEKFLLFFLCVDPSKGAR